MAILIEAICVVIRRSAIDATYDGGWSAFHEAIPHGQWCANSHLVRVGFMRRAGLDRYDQE